ncbi:MAG: ABC transporter ATP-binding protein/permease [Oscillospiraceae bacterium]|jgi:ATP-binding cassette subfamily B protein|nr:ABC transporter ATP-binding protein/permease [Oscillospiraceae bacterium]
MAQQNRPPSDFVPPPIMGANRQGRMPGMGRVPGVKPKNMKRTLLRLWAYFKTERLWLAAVFALETLRAATTLLAPYWIGRGIDAAGLIDINGMHPVLIIAGLLVIAYAVGNVSQMLTSYIMAAVSQRTVKLLRSGLFDHMQRLPVSYFDTHAHGDIMSRVTNDIDNVSSTISTSTSQLMGLVLSLIGSLFMMLSISPLMTLALLVPSALALLLTRTITTRTRPLFSRQQAALGGMMGQLEESVSGLAVVHAFNREAESIEDFDIRNREYFRSSLSAMVWSGLMMPLMNVINNLSLTFIAYAGSTLALSGMISIGVIASFVTYSRQFIRPLNDVANIYNTLQTAVAGAERVFEMFDEAEETPDAPDAATLERADGEVSFKNVVFGYNPNAPVIQDVSFDVPAGSSIALVGRTGAGKTTLVNLLARFYELTGGSITIDGIDVRRYTRSSLRRAFGIVLQDTVLFEGSVLDNIRYGNPDASEDECAQAARRAEADPFIRRLPEGYNTMLTESGGNLSAGQRQLLAIARAILADCPILILDEATSSVDTRTEQRIQRAMLELMRGRTTFLIAHRLSTIRDANRILVLDQGRIVEQGTHDQLLAAGGVYAGMWNSQAANLAT